MSTESDRVKICNACGAEQKSGAWLCECGQDLREVRATVEGSGRLRQQGRRRRWFLATPLGGLALGGCLGLLVGASGPASWLGTSFDVTVYGSLGALGGLLFGVVAAVVGWVAAR